MARKRTDDIEETARQIRLEYAHDLMRKGDLAGIDALVLVVWPKPSLELASLQAAMDELALEHAA